MGLIQNDPISYMHWKQGIKRRMMMGNYPNYIQGIDSIESNKIDENKLNNQELLLLL